MSDHDVWLANYQRSDVDAWCENTSCPNHEGVTVTLERENGQGSLTPEECWICGGRWLEDPPEEPEQKTTKGDDR